MAEGRMLKKRISESKRVAGLSSDSVRLLYTWLIPWLDVEGRHTADAEIIKGRVFPKVKSWAVEKVEAGLLELHRSGLLTLFVFDGECFLEYEKNLQKLRTDREAPSSIPKAGDCVEVPKDARSLREYAGSAPGELRVKLSQVKLSQVKVKCDDAPPSLENPIVELRRKIILYFNEVTGQKRRSDNAEVAGMINGRVSEGHGFEDFKHVIDTKAAQWGSDEKMRIYLRPSTLFRPGHFEDYLNEPYRDPKKKPLRVGENPKVESPLPYKLWLEVAALINKTDNGGDAPVERRLMAFRSDIDAVLGDADFGKEWSLIKGQTAPVLIKFVEGRVATVRAKLEKGAF